MLANPELQKTAREEAKGIPFPLAPLNALSLQLANLQRPSYKSMLVEAEQSVLT